MAVQAQYPSNVLLLNRSGQEGNEFPLQQQAGGVFLDQSHSHMLFNNNNNNPRKRGREVAGAAITAPINSYSMQTQPPQLIELSQLHHPNVVSTGLRLSFGDQQQKLQQHQNQNQNQSYRQQQQQQQNLVSNSSVFASDDLVTQIKRQRDELDHFLQAQGEELRRTLAEKRHRHYRALLEAAEESVARRFREKEAEVEKAKRRNVELEARAVQLGAEVQVWQAKAKAQEVTAASLQAQLQQAIMNGGAGLTQQDSRRGGEEWRKRAGGESEAQAEDAESAYVDPGRVVSAASGPCCKACRTRAAAVVLLPCRHLCLCTECDRVAQACPLCLTFRNSSVEVFLS